VALRDAVLREALVMRDEKGRGRGLEEKRVA
jgi:hypothetical protein